MSEKQQKKNKSVFRGVQLTPQVSQILDVILQHPDFRQRCIDICDSSENLDAILTEGITITVFHDIVCYGWTNRDNSRKESYNPRQMFISKSLLDQAQCEDNIHAQMILVITILHQLGHVLWADYHGGSTCPSTPVMNSSGNKLCGESGEYLERFLIGDKIHHVTGQTSDIIVMACLGNSVALKDDYVSKFLNPLTWQQHKRINSWKPTDNDIAKVPDDRKIIRHMDLDPPYKIYHGHPRRTANRVY
jgi:hypothetical protein